MYAVMKTGGKQYRVAPGDVLRIEKIEAAEGETVQFNDVLMLGGDAPKLGTPLVDGAAVQAEVLGQVKADKVINFVRRRRKHSSKRTKGHRQKLTTVRITEIVESGGGGTGVKSALGIGAALAAGLVATAAVATAVATAPARAASKAAAKADTSGDEKPAAKKAPKPSADVDSGAKPANLMDAPPPGGADDLKKLSGVGPKLEQKLHDAGVYTFAQIAAWGPDEVAHMDEKLSFKGRIERDNWIEQANQFAAEKE